MDRYTKTFVEEEQEEKTISKQQTTSFSGDSDSFPGYDKLSDLTKLTLSLESLLNDAVNKKTETTKIVSSKRTEIEPLLEALLECMQPKSLTYVESLQIRRLTNTLEFGTLDSVPQLKKCKQTVLTTLKKLELKDVSPSLEDKKLQNRQIELMYAAIKDIWSISSEEFTKIITNLKFARHGETKVSGKATWDQVEGCFGELMICCTMVQMIDQEASKSKLYKWTLEGLMIQILQNTARRYKVKTILEAVTGINELCPLLLSQYEKKFITEDAFTSIKQCLQYHIVEAVSDKAKEQFRQLQILTCVIQQHPEFVCVGYEEPVSNTSGSDIRADILFDGGDAGKFVIEIEGLPDKEQKNAYTYLKGRYEKKTQTIGKPMNEKGYKLVLVLPLDTEVPEKEWKLISEDTSITVWLFKK
ncbi:MAG TPA: hypothetical protein VFB60_17135 [Ktedonobacteraceae bacterium]|nr:hypothetical protein [Ktedonobacteraceae bacterium]